MRWLLLLIPLAVAIVIFATVVRDLVRRARRRASVKDLDERFAGRQVDAGRLAGGAPEHPIEIETPALVEPMATAEKCLRCGGDLHLLEHSAERRGEDRLRVADMKCPRCGTGRRLFFRLPVQRLH
jgi:hypothetical protein